MGNRGAAPQERMNDPVKATTAIGAAPGSAAGKPTAAVTLFWCLMGLLLPRATLYGELAPFGISLAAAATGGTLPVTAALIAGYLLAGGVLYPLRYIAAVAVVGGLRWVLAAVPGWRERPVLPPLLAATANLLTGLLFLGRSGMDAFRLLLLLAESLTAGGAAYFFRMAEQFSRRAAEPRPQKRLQLTAGEQAALVLTGAVALMAATTLEIQGFAPGRVLAAGLVLVLARTGRETGGAIAGVVVGACTALAVPGQTVLAMALAFGGLLAGLFARFGRLAEAGAFFVAAGVVALSDSGEHTLIHLYELCAGGLLFLVLPRAWDGRLSRLFLRSRELPAVEGLRRAVTLRLQVAAGALREASGAVSEVSERLSRYGAPDLPGLQRECRRQVCGSCPMESFCWEQHGEEAAAALEQLTERLPERGLVTAEDTADYLRQSCRRKEQLADRLSRGYDRLLVQEATWRRLQEIQGSLHSQCAGMTELLTTLAAQLEDPGQVDTELSARVMAACEDEDMTVQEALCTRDAGNRLTVEIVIAEAEMPAGGRWLRRLEELCGTRLAPPAAVPCGSGTRITLSEPPRFRVEVGVSRLACDHEKLCGDAIDHFSGQGHTTVILSDGMGSGGRAAVDSAMTVGLCSRLWQAGFSPAGILQTVNAALMTKSREESLATLDVVQIDAFTGRLDFYKAGAAASLLCSGGRVSRLEESSLPAGILPDVRLSHGHDWLGDGDILLLASDGAYTDGVAPVEDLLREHPPEEDMTRLAQRITAAVRRSQTEHQDDITVAVLRLHRLEQE